MHGSRKNFLIILLSLLALRVIIGLHFFSEGITKVQDGDFTCAGFLGAAKGPFADSFAELLDDPDGLQRLCVYPKDESTITRDESGNVVPMGVGDWTVNPQPVCEFWSDYVARASLHFQFDSAEKKQANETLKQSQQYLSDYLQSNEQEILAWVAGANRLSGFERDGIAKERTVTWVDSLNGQLDTIKGDRKKKAYGWLSEVELAWDELESQINMLGGVENPEDTFPLARPFKPRNSPQFYIDSMLPWFDTIVGVLLILGLFTRLASVLAIGLLGGVVMTQPFWIPGVQNTYYQWIEIGGLFVLIATAAGQFGGLDYFLMRKDKTDSSQD